MASASGETTIHRMFETGIILKGLHAVAEVVGGALILVLNPGTILNVLLRLSAVEFTYSRRDLIDRALLDVADRVLNGAQVFVGAYLLIHGLINGAIVAGLLLGWLWAYPAGLLAIAIFMAYQGYRYTLTHSVALIALTVFDAIVLWLVWHEYGVVRAGRRRKARATP